MSRTKDRYWPDEGRTPRPRALLQAFRAAWLEFKRVREQQRRRSHIPDPFKETT
jgi:hypothetical protein